MGKLIVSAADAKEAAMMIEGVVDAYVLTGRKGGLVVTAIVKGRDLEKVRADLEKRFRKDMPITIDRTIEVLEGEA